MIFTMRPIVAEIFHFTIYSPFFTGILAIVPSFIKVYVVAIH
jgi:hypothetical protein